MAMNRLTGEEVSNAKTPASKKKSVLKNVEIEEVVEEVGVLETSGKPVFAIDLGNHQTKLKSLLGEYVYSSSYIDSSKLPAKGFNTVEIEGNETYQIAGERSKFTWGSNLGAYNRSEEMIQTISRTDRFGKKNARRLLEFALAKLAFDFPETSERAMDIRVVLGVPITDANSHSNTTRALKELTVGTHAVEVNGVTVYVRVESEDDVAIVPQYMGTAVNLAFDDDMNEFPAYSQGRLAMLDIGGGTILGNVVSNLQPEPDGTETFMGADKLVRDIAGREGVTRLPIIERMLREGNVEEGYIYRPTRNEKDIRDMTETVVEATENYTRLTVASFLTTTFGDIENFDYIVMTGGGVNLIDTDALLDEIGEKYYDKLIFVEESELANVRGFFKLSNLVWQD